MIFVFEWEGVVVMWGCFFFVFVYKKIKEVRLYYLWCDLKLCYVMLGDISYVIICCVMLCYVMWC